MTANRWWVRLGARWLAKIDGVSGQLRLAMLALTGLSTASVALSQYGYGRYAWPLIAGVSMGMVGYTHVYSEGGVWNQTRRDKADLATNWAGPNMLITNVILTRSLMAGEKGEPLDDTEREAILAEAEAAWREYRDGIELGEHQ